MIFGFAAFAFLGYWLAGTAAPRRVARENHVAIEVVPKRIVPVDDEMPKFKRGERGPSAMRDEEASKAGALSNQRVLVFKDRAALEDFLKRAGDRIRLMGRLDALNALRVGFLNYGDLAELLTGNEEASLIFPVDIPTRGQGKAQDSAVALGAGLLDSLGITGDNSSWGKGILIAILDTGVMSNPAFKSRISSINLVPLPGDLSTQNGHATAVASMIIGQGSLTPGVAPGADILSIRIANDLGQSDSYLLASGILAAVDGGAKIINISMGSDNPSPLITKALEYAYAAGVLVVAAVGNNGTNQVSHPAADPGVIGLGAVDARNDHLDFSNTGNQVAISTAGFGINAAWQSDQAAAVSGTSFSSPIFVGAVAGVAGVMGISIQKAAELLISHANDGGVAGADSVLGAGTLDVGRALNAVTPGIYDAALASQRVTEPTLGAPNGEIEVLVQNRGTETLINTAVDVSTPAGTTSANITSLAPNAVQTVRVPIPQASSAPLLYDSRVRLSGGIQDSKPSNDRRVDQFIPGGK
ncbi:MAG: S8 family serine peptidase [Luteolibacter sp.]